MLNKLNAVQEHKRCEEAQREAEGHAGQAAEAGRRAERLAGEAGELQAALEQKQELIAALQVGGLWGGWGVVRASGSDC